MNRFNEPIIWINCSQKDVPFLHLDHTRYLEPSVALNNVNCWHCSTKSTIIKTAYNKQWKCIHMCHNDLSVSYQALLWVNNILVSSCRDIRADRELGMQWPMQSPVIQHLTVGHSYASSFTFAIWVITLTFHVLSQMSKPLEPRLAIVSVVRLYVTCSKSCM